ncbi:alpha/beta fold hydrolase [Pseudonocardia sp. CA-142604]|uniref:alpha/beta fold hydrolase n=1 Tax=Pseudonocardia sp. CA-142604 TaxID=3240024 RepID=UPI003D8D4477
MENPNEERAAVAPPLGSRWDVSDGAMWLHKSEGEGVPVVWLAGGGMFGLYYWNVHQLAAEFTTSVIYDRLGTGWSDAVDLPRSSTQVTDDLRELLNAAGVTDPCVLVGHSLGGLYARHFAKRFPGDVAGLVLADPTHEDVVPYLPEQAAQRMTAWTSDIVLPFEQVEAMRSTYEAVFGKALASWPDRIRNPLLAQAFSSEVYARSLREPMDLLALFDEVRASGPDPDIPVVVLSAMGSDAFTGELLPPEARASARQSAQAKHRCFNDFVASIPRAQLRRIDDAGHSGLIWERSDAVLDAIRGVLASEALQHP